ncbi:alpha/beta hydrolase [Euhalothece natronophila]|nr:alpha/beta hydrolase [Euhalothece natronophila]
MKRTNHHQKTLFGKLFSSVIGIASLLMMSEAQAAENINLRLGPFEQQIKVEDLEHYGETGEVPQSLRLLRPVLTQDVRQMLTRPLEFDEAVLDRFAIEMLQSPQIQPLRDQLQTAFPESDFEEVILGLYLALKRGNGLSLLNFLSAYPQETLTIDLTAVIGLGIQLNFSYLQSQILGPILAQELKVDPTESFRPEFDPAASGDHNFNERSLIFRDKTRDRAIVADLYLPETKPEGPLVVLSHGYAANRRFLTYLARHLASHGYTVASLEHPGSNINYLSRSDLAFDLGELLSPQELLERPQDVSFLLNELARLNRHPGMFEDQFNTDEVTMIGHSLGGYTALAVAGGELDLRAVRRFCRNVTPLGRSPADWLQCSGVELPNGTMNLHDNRIRRVVALNPLVSKLFGDDGLGQIEVPTLVFSSSKDAITPSLNNQLKPFAQLSGEKYLLSAIGATHMTVTDLRDKSSPIAQNQVVPELIGKSAEPVRNWIRGTTLAFIKQNSSEAEKYEPFLTPEYAQFLSTPNLSFRVTQEVPPFLELWLKGMHWTYEKVVVRTPPSSNNIGNGFLAQQDNTPFSEFRLNFPLLGRERREDESYRGKLEEVVPPIM